MWRSCSRHRDATGEAAHRGTEPADYNWETEQVKKAIHESLMSLELGINKVLKSQHLYPQELNDCWEALHLATQLDPTGHRG